MENEKYLITVSRDKKIRVYLTENLDKILEKNIGVPVTAVDTYEI